MITLRGQDEYLTIEDLRAIAPQRQEKAGRRWQPIPHGYLADTLTNLIHSHGWGIVESRYSLSPNRDSMAGAYLLAGPGLPQVPGCHHAISFVNTNNRRKALTLTAGVVVKEYDIGVPFGVLVKHKHNALPLRVVLGEALEAYAANSTHLPAGVRVMQRQKVTAAQASEALVGAARRRLVGWGAVGRVDHEFHNPTLQHEGGNDTAWALVSAFSYTARVNPLRQVAVVDDFRVSLLG